MTEEDERLINQAHDLIGHYSIFEIFDIDDRAETIRVMIEIHGDEVDLGKVEGYFAVLDRLRKYTG